MKNTKTSNYCELAAFLAFFARFTACFSKVSVSFCANSRDRSAKPLRAIGLPSGSAGQPRHSLVEVTLEAVPQQHKEGGLRATYRVLASEVVDGRAVRAKQFNQFPEGSRSLPLGKHASVQTRQRISILLQETTCLLAGTLYSSNCAVQIAGGSLCAGTCHSAKAT